MRLRRGFTWASGVLCTLLALARAHGYDPTIQYRTLETPHFSITYWAQDERLARRLAVVAEQAHGELTRALGHATRHKTQILLTDDTDDPNGSAGVLPYAQVRLFLTAPDDRSELNDYDDWLRELITHEYTHIVHLDTIGGVARVINWILGFGEHGYVYAPNQWQPRFVLEGLAVVEETAFTSGGRLRSSIYDMWLRTAALEGKLQRLDQFSNSPIQWPRGGSPYLYGSAFLRYIADRFGDGALGKLSRDYGSNWIPWAMNRSLRRAVGKTFAELYPDFKQALADRYRAQEEHIGRVQGGITPSLVLTVPRETSLRPAFTPDGREVVWCDSDMYTRPRLRRIAVPETIAPDAPRPRPESELLVDGASGVAIAKDGRSLYYTAIDVWRTFFLYGDLWRLDRASGDKTRLTDGLRAAEPDLSPDGKTLAFEVDQLGTRSLVTMPAAGGPLTWLVDTRADLSQIYTPSWSPDGKKLAFSWWREGGYRDLWVIDVATRALERITADRAIDMDPRWSPDGKYIYFSSDRTGVYNLYAFELSNGRTWQVTNVLGGAFDVAIAPDGKRAVYVGFQADGWRLEAIPLAPATWHEAPAAVDNRPDKPAPRGEWTGESHGYQPWRTLWPRTLFVQSYPDAFGQVIALGVGAIDLAGRHEWTTTIGFSLARADDISVAAGYQYTRLWPTLGLSATRGLSLHPLALRGVKQDYVEDDYTAAGYASFPLYNSINEASSLTLGYQLAWMRDNGDLPPPDPRKIEPPRPETGQLSTVTLAWSWSTIRRFTMSLSNATGWNLGVSLSASLRGLGSQYDVFSASWSALRYVALGGTHVLRLSYAGGLSGGDLRRRGLFGLGGYAAQPNILTSLIDGSRPGLATLRGYPTGSIYGDSFHVASVEYRFPIAWIQRGYQTLPFFLSRLHGAIFVDAGNAYFGPFDWRGIRVGAGAELRLELQLGFYLPVSLQLGYARGFMSGGGDQVYFLLNNPF